MTQNNEDKGSSVEQVQQASKNAARSGKAAEAPGFDKKLDGPNRPST